MQESLSILICTGSGSDKEGQTNASNAYQRIFHTAWVMFSVKQMVKLDESKINCPFKFLFKQRLESKKVKSRQFFVFMNKICQFLSKFFIKLHYFSLNKSCLSKSLFQKKSQKYFYIFQNYHSPNC